MAIDFRRHLVARWHDPQPSHVPILKQVGIQGVLLRKPDEAFEKACTAAGIQTMPETALKTVKVENITPNPGPYAALAHGLWPGISRGPSAGRDDESSSASREPWVDANGFWTAYLRAIYPTAAPVMAYEANEASGVKSDRIIPYDTLPLALAEARVMGGNFILDLEPKFREALLKNDPKAAGVWKQLGDTSKWLEENRALFERELMPTITMIVESGEETAEIANLAYRRGASPRLTSTVPAPSKDILVLVTTAMRKPAPDVAKRILAHALEGATVVTDATGDNTWWKVPGLKEVKNQEDRIFYQHGKGMVVAYKDQVVDPSEHALDIIDFAGHPRRPIRIWNASSVIAVASQGAAHFLNYGGGPNGVSRRDRGEIQARIQGIYKTATLIRPDGPPINLEAKTRGTTTEVFVPELTRVGTVLFR
jgi:hypothetical protein